MPDKCDPLGPLAVMRPQQNSIIQPEYKIMRPKGVSDQACRLDIPVHDPVHEVDTIQHVGEALGATNMVDDLKARLSKLVQSATATGDRYDLQMLGLTLTLGAKITRMALPPAVRYSATLVG